MIFPGNYGFRVIRRWNIGYNTLFDVLRHPYLDFDRLGMHTGPLNDQILNYSTFRTTVQSVFGASNQLDHSERFHPSVLVFHPHFRLVSTLGCLRGYRRWRFASQTWILDQNHTWNEPGTRSLSELIGRELNAISSQGSDAAFFSSIYLMKRDQSMWIKPVYKVLGAVWSPQNGLFLKIHRFFSDCFRDFSVEISDDQLKVARNAWKLF